MLVSIPEFTVFILDFRNGAAVRHLGISYFRNICKKNQTCAYFYVHMQNLVPIGRPAAQSLRIFDFTIWRPSAILGLVCRHIGPLTTCV